MFPKAQSAELLAYGDIKIYFIFVEDELAAKNLDIKNLDSYFVEDG